MPGNHNLLRLFSYAPIGLYMATACAALVYVCYRAHRLARLDRAQKCTLVLRAAALVITYIAFIFWAVFDRVLQYLGRPSEFMVWMHELGSWSYPLATSAVWLLSDTVLAEFARAGVCCTRCYGALKTDEGGASTPTASRRPSTVAASPATTLRTAVADAYDHSSDYVDLGGGEAGALDDRELRADSLDEWNDD